MVWLGKCGSSFESGWEGKLSGQFDLSLLPLVLQWFCFFSFFGHTFFELGGRGAHKSTEVLPLPSQFSLQAGGVMVPGTDLPSCSSSPTPFVEAPSSTLSSSLATPSASTDSSSEDCKVCYHLRSRSVVKGDLLEVGFRHRMVVVWDLCLALSLWVKEGAENHTYS
jgi:hypothetical protein